MSKHLQAELADLRQLEQCIRRTGKVSPSGRWLDTYTSRGRRYARLRAEKAIFDGKFTMGLGRIGSPDHRDWQARIKRRNAIQEIERRAIAIQSWLDNPIWESDEDQTPVPEGMRQVEEGDRYLILEDTDGSRWGMSKAPFLLITSFATKPDRLQGFQDKGLSDSLDLN